MTKQLRATMAAILVISSISLQAQTSTAATKTTSKAVQFTRRHPPRARWQRQIRELREQMQSQQAQIDALKQQNADKDAKLAAAQQSAQEAQAAAASASAKADSLSSNLSVEHRGRLEPQQHRDRPQDHQRRPRPDHQRHQEDRSPISHRVAPGNSLQGCRDHTGWLLRG